MAKHSKKTEGVTLEDFAKGVEEHQYFMNNLDKFSAEEKLARLVDHCGIYSFLAREYPKAVDKWKESMHQIIDSI